MLRNTYGRKVLFAGDIHSFLVARQQYAQLVAEHRALLAELVDLKAQVSELREVLQVVVSVSRQRAETDVAMLRRQLETALARIERPSKPLH